MKNSIKSENYPKSETLKHSTLIDWHIKPSVPCSGRKSTSENMSVDSVQNWHPQLTLKLSLVRLCCMWRDNRKIIIPLVVR